MAADWRWVRVGQVLTGHTVYPRQTRAHAGPQQPGHAAAHFTREERQEERE